LQKAAAEADEKHQHSSSGGKVKKGGRDNLLFKQACKLRNAGLSQSDALSTLLEFNKTHCDPPMEESVVQQKIESAYSYESSKQPTHKELIKNPNLLALTDWGNAQRLVKADGKSIRYCYQNKSWFVWDDRRWAKDENGEIHRIAKKTVKSMLHEAADVDDDRSKVLVAHEQKCESEGRLNAMVNLANSLLKNCFGTLF